MRPIPAPRIGDSHGILRAIEERGRLRTDELVTEFSLEQLFPPELENAVGRMRHFISYARAAGLIKEDRGVVELTEVGRRYVRAGDAAAPFDVSEQQAEWLRRQLREKHMTDSIFHGMAIGLSLLASAPPGVRVSTLDFGRALAYLGRAGWDNENTLQIQGERYLTLLVDVELIDLEQRLTGTGEQVRGELTLPVHMSLLDIAGQLNPGGADAVRAEADAEWAGREAGEKPSETGYHDVVPGSYAPSATNGEGALPAAAPADDQAEAEEPADAGEAAAPAQAPSAGPPVPPDDIWESAGPEDATRAIPAAQPPVVPRASDPETPAVPAPTAMTPGDPLAADTPTVVTPPGGEAVAAPSDEVARDDAAAEAPAPAPASGDVAAGGLAGLAEAPAPASGDVAPGGLAGLADAARAAVPEVARPAEGAVPAAAGPPAADVAALSGAAAAGLAGGGHVPAPADVAPLAAAAAAVPAGGDIAALGRAALAGSTGDLRGDAAAFVDPTAIRTAAEGAGLRFPDSVYANVAAGLGAGKHLLLTGAPGAGKTSLALAVARAAAQAGRANGATLVTASRDWGDQGVLVESAKRGRWVIVDELDRARLDDALGGLSSFLAGLPVQLAGGDEATPDGNWRIVATAARAPEASAALLRRFAVVEVLGPAGQVLVEAVNVAARGDATAAAAVARLVPLAEVAPLGAGVFIDAARHAAARHAAAPADEATLARDAYAAYIAPLLGELDDAGVRRVRDIVGEA
jgi:MoxR-like ATPase